MINMGLKEDIKWFLVKMVTKICRKFLFRCIGWFSTKLGEVLSNIHSKFTSKNVFKTVILNTTSIQMHFKGRGCHTKWLWRITRPSKMTAKDGVNVTFTQIFYLVNFFVLILRHEKWEGWQPPPLARQGFNNMNIFIISNHKINEWLIRFYGNHRRNLGQQTYPRTNVPTEEAS